MWQLLGVLTDAQCAELASKLAGHWRKLAPKLGLAEEKVGCCPVNLRCDATMQLLSGGSYGGGGGRGGGQVCSGVCRLERSRGRGRDSGGDQLCP